VLDEPTSEVPLVRPPAPHPPAHGTHDTAGPEAPGAVAEPEATDPPVEGTATGTTPAEPAAGAGTATPVEAAAGTGAVSEEETRRDTFGGASEMAKMFWAPTASGPVPVAEPAATVEPEATAPEATAPEATAPEATAPEATAPEATAPEATAPEATAPEATAAGAAEAEAAQAGAPGTIRPDTGGAVEADEAGADEDDSGPEVGAPAVGAPEAAEAEVAEAEVGADAAEAEVAEAEVGADAAEAGAYQGRAPDRTASAEPAERAPGDLDESAIALWPDGTAERLREQWRDLQVRFVDDPTGAVAGAKDLVTEAVQDLADALLAAQAELDPYKSTDRADTESMRVAMRRYREFLDRVLAL
jgi:hypothetical protein